MTDPSSSSSFSSSADSFGGVGNRKGDSENSNIAGNNDTFVGGSPNVLPSQSQLPQNMRHAVHQPAAVPNYNSYFHAPPPSEGSGLIQSTALFTAGSFIGLTAVAALRWLNGDDFYLWPSPADLEARQQHKQPYQQQQQPVSNTNHDNQLILQQMQTIQRSLEIQQEQQAIILQRIQSNGEFRINTFTDESMNRLREQQSSASSPLVQEQLIMEETTTGNKATEYEQLQEIHLELMRLRSDLALQSGGDDSGKEWKMRLNQTIDQLHNYLTKVDGTCQPLDASIASTASAPGTLTDVTAEAETVRTMINPNADMNAIADSSLTVLAVDGKDETAEAAHKLVEAILTLATENKDPAVLQSGAQLLYLYVHNLCNHHKVPRYRKIFTCNESFLKVEALMGAREFLAAVGFCDNKNTLEWLASPGKDEDDEEVYLNLLKEATKALNVIKASGATAGSDLVYAALSTMELNATDAVHESDCELSEASPHTKTTLLQSPIRASLGEPSSIKKLPQPQLVNDSYNTPRLGSITSPPTIKHARSPSHSFPFDYESPMQNMPPSDQLNSNDHSFSADTPIRNDLEQLLADTPARDEIDLDVSVDTPVRTTFGSLLEDGKLQRSDESYGDSTKSGALTDNLIHADESAPIFLGDVVDDK
ncbi:hypothetical protein MPSEU_000798700 [Mayamaea pseudoterrestris]|nr:hypothetical protein MPSEU_000798700 [Mayamaea pseudoterrestris]